MKIFRFKRFGIRQNPEVFRVGTDAVLLGALCNPAGRNRGLEIGCGTGIVSLMVAQRNPLIEILALDINSTAVELCHQNFEESPFCKRLKTQECDVNQYANDKKFDFIFSNPPYFQGKQSKDLIARHQLYLSFSQLICKSAKLLSGDGRFSVIIPSETGGSFTEECSRNGLFLCRQVNVFGIQGGPLKRNILEFSKTRTEAIHEIFTIEKEERVFSDQYIEATRDFHPMF